MSVHEIIVPFHSERVFRSGSKYMTPDRRIRRLIQSNVLVWLQDQDCHECGEVEDFDSPQNAGLKLWCQYPRAKKGTFDIEEVFAFNDRDIAMLFKLSVA